jgi:hypothetical protein
VWKLFRQVGSPYLAPPGTPKDRVDILQEAMRRTLNDSEFHREFLKLVGDEVEPLLASELTKLVKSAPRDAETIDMLKVISGAGPLPPR